MTSIKSVTLLPVQQPRSVGPKRSAIMEDLEAKAKEQIQKPASNQAIEYFGIASLVSFGAYLVYMVLMGVFGG